MAAARRRIRARTISSPPRDQATCPHSGARRARPAARADPAPGARVVGHEDRPARRSDRLPGRRRVGRGRRPATSGTSRAASTAATCSRWGRSSRWRTALGAAPWLVQRLWLALGALPRRLGRREAAGGAAAGRGRVAAVAATCSTRTWSCSPRGRRSRCWATRRCRGCCCACVRGLRGRRVLALAGGVRADRHRLGRRRERGGDGLGAARAGAAGAVRAVDRHVAGGRCGASRWRTVRGDRVRVGLVGRPAAGAVALRRGLPALHRAAGDDLVDHEPVRVAAADGLLDLLPGRRLRRGRAAVLRRRRRAAVRAARGARGVARAGAGAAAASPGRGGRATRRSSSCWCWSGCW